MDNPATSFSPYFNQTARVLVIKSDDFSLATQSTGFRLPQSGDWQPTCVYNQQGPKFENTSSKVGYGAYFQKTGTYSMLVQVKLNGYVVTSVFTVSVNQEASINGAGSGVMQGWLEALLILAVLAIGLV